MAGGRLRVNTPTVVSETVDGEVVMVHLGSGNYYSLRSTGAAIWEAIDAGVTIDAIAEQLASASHNGHDVGSLVTGFVDELRAEDLVVADPDQEPIPCVVLAGTFEPPVLEKFTDMAHLILLDPVHEVDVAEGWPRPHDDP
jgi:hypothetical protein